jgi:hypothetical protein
MAEGVYAPGYAAALTTGRDPTVPFLCALLHVKIMEIVQVQGYALCALLHVKIMEIVQVQGYASVLMVGQDMTAPFMSVILTV